MVVRCTHESHIIATLNITQLDQKPQAYHFALLLRRMSGRIYWHACHVLVLMVDSTDTGTIETRTKKERRI